MTGANNAAVSHRPRERPRPSEMDYDHASADKPRSKRKRRCEEQDEQKLSKQSKPSSTRDDLNDHDDDSRSKRRRKEKRKGKSSKKAYHADEQDDHKDSPSKDGVPFSHMAGAARAGELGSHQDEGEDQQKFVWIKKRERDRKRGITASEQRRRDEENREETRVELEKLMKRRSEREIEIQLREQEMVRLQREADRAALGDWEAKERDFHLKQAQKRAEIRIRERRMKPLDLLSIGLRFLYGDKKVDDEWLNYHLPDPASTLESLSHSHLVESEKEIQSLIELEKDASSLKFWKALLDLARDVIRKREDGKGIHAHVGVNEDVYNDVTNMLSKKSMKELQELERHVESKIKSGEPVNSEYWDTLLESLKAWKARKAVMETHDEILKKRMWYMEKGKFQVDDKPEILDRGWVKDSKTAGCGEVSSQSRGSGNEAGSGPGGENGSRGRGHEMQRFAHDRTRLDGEVEADVIAMQKRFGTEMGPDEEVFMDEAFVGSQTYGWSDKYRPRKPRYFNRVHTGYEWNKYNQTHYDSDNPPPKVVQGYKFNVFYPDLIDKQKTPTYRIERDEAASGGNAGSHDDVSNETVIIRFVAGPPYEDVAFRIVNREWEYSHKKGFRCSFDRGVLQLHFHFKRHYYRR